MNLSHKPKIGLLGLMTGGYEAIFPGFIARQEVYATEIIATLSSVADVHYTGIGLDRASIEQSVKEYNDADVDGILIVLLAYSQGAHLLRALQYNRLPLAMAVIQPEQEVQDDWEELDMTLNQGIHGAQDNSNVLVRAGFTCEFFAGNRHDHSFTAFVADFAKAAQTKKYLSTMRTAVFGRMAGMGDVLADEMAFFSKVGPEICHETIGSVYSYMQVVTKQEIDQQIEQDRVDFALDPRLTYESHAEAIKMYIGFKRFLQDNHYQAFTAHFDIFAADGRFKQLPLYAASRLLAEGYGYAAEGDVVCASIVAAAHCLGDGNGNFTEMYAMDFVKQAILFCHAGEGNWATHRKDKKAQLIDRYLGEGGLENPPTLLFTPEPGRASIVSLASLKGEAFRLILANGNILDKADLTKCEMPYLFWQPDSSIETCVEQWLKYAGTHHEVITLGDYTRRWKMLCRMLDIEYVEV